MAFIITLGGHPVEARTSYAHYKRAAQVAHRRYSDPKVSADKLPHIKRRTWIEKGYRVEPSRPAPPPSEDPRWEAIRNPGIVCPGAGPLLPGIDTSPMNRALCPSDFLYYPYKHRR